MTLKINTNIPGMFANNQINKGYGDLTNSLSKISSGYTINKAADDASGMSIADSLKSRALGLGQAAKNASDGISIVQIADGALNEATNILQTIREKSLQAANASQSYESRQAIQADIGRSLQALNNIAQSTSFNGQKLLSGAFTDKTFVVGPDAANSVNISIDSVESTALGQGDQVEGSLADIDVTTQDGAQNAIQVVDNALSQINQVRSDLGSTQNQFESRINNLLTTQINTLASESQIRDVDLAEESMNLSRMETLLKARLFAQAQANASQKNITNLLG